MSPIRGKFGSLRLDPVSYRLLRLEILRRDNWRCQLCGTMSNLEVHHKEFRSHSGARLKRKSDHAMCTMPRTNAWLLTILMTLGSFSETVPAGTQQLEEVFT